MNEPDFIYKTRPNCIFISLIAFGGLFFGYWAYTIYTMAWVVNGASEQVGHIIIAIFLALFGGFSVLCFIMAIGFRVFYLTQTELIIKRPLLFYKRHVSLTEIIRILQSEEPIVVKYSEIYRGKKATLKVHNGRQIKITSFEVWGYRELIKRLTRQSRIC